MHSLLIRIPISKPQNQSLPPIQVLEFTLYSKMKFLTILSAFAFMPLVLSAPVAVSLGQDLTARDGNRGQYTIPGLGARKQAILNAGGNTQDLAIAMLET